MTFRACLAAAAMLLPVLSGCGSSRLSSFPEFPSHKTRLGKCAIITDFLVLKGTGGDTAAVDLGANKASADTLLRFVQGELDAKGYNVTNRLLSSVGLATESVLVANVSHTSEMDRAGEDAAITYRSPFYLYQPLRRDPGFSLLLGTLYRKLLRLEESDSGYPAFPEMVPLAKTFGGGMIFIFLGGGFEVSPAEAAAEGTPGTGGVSKIAYQRVSQASLHLFVLDPDTGSLLWTDRRSMRGGMVYDDKFIRMAGFLLEDLP